jgi:hypothetical protein
MTPRLSNTLIIGDDPHLLAELSSLLGRTRTYVPVFDGPRMWRPDADLEVTFRSNAAARSKARNFILAGLPDASAAEFRSRFPAARTFALKSTTQALAAGVVREKGEKLRAPHSKPGPALLAALRSQRQLEFDDEVADLALLERGRRHLVVCEEGDLHAQVVAANYAFAFEADLILIPKADEDVAESLLAELYGVYEQHEMSATDVMREITAELRLRSGVEVGAAPSITFFTERLPWGFAYPEVPSSHIFNFPSVGLTVLNGIRGLERPVRVCVGIDPGEVEATEVETTAKALASCGTYVSVRRGSRANVRNVSRTLELYPYDMLLISTHCGDAGGWRWTYRFPDHEGRERTLVVDVAISVADIPDSENYEVIKYKRFVSLDGVDWADREGKKRLPVGSAMHAYVDAIRAEPTLEPVCKENVDRVHGSAALRMSDGNYLAAMRTLADHGQPIIINNACASWHELAMRFSFADCRCYVGTLFNVSNGEAQDVISRVIEKHRGKPIALALWHAQREIYGDSPRRPYAVMGVYLQPLRTSVSDGPRMIETKLQHALEYWKTRLNDSSLSRTTRFTMTDYITYLESEMAVLNQRWAKGTLRP